MLSDDRRDYEAVMRLASDAGAVTLERSRSDGRIDQIVLADPDALYGFLERAKPAATAQAAEAALLASLPNLRSDLATAIGRIAAAWAEKRNLVRDLGPTQSDDAVRILKAAQTLLDGQVAVGTDLRTFSRRATGDSKFVEGNAGRIADVLRLTRDFPDCDDAADVLTSFGLLKYPHACLLSGPVVYNDILLPTAPYLGVAPEMCPDLRVAGQPEWILLIENLASFNRQVREAAGGSKGIVVYAGGFPSDATLQAILALARATTCTIWHWGDIDPGGLKIAHHIECALGNMRPRFHLHMMSPDIALRHGAPVEPQSVFGNIDVGESVVAELADFLASTNAHNVEQEELDPSVPIAAST